MAAVVEEPSLLQIAVFDLLHHSYLDFNHYHCGSRFITPTAIVVPFKSTSRSLDLSEGVVDDLRDMTTILAC